MRIRFKLGALLAVMASRLLACASPAMAKGGGGGGGGGGGTTTVPAVSFDVTVNNRCTDEGGGAKGSVAVAFTTFDTATGAQLFTGVYMQPAFAIMT
jgi:hypothetical protein